MSKKSFNSPKQYLRHQLVPPGVWAVCQESKWRTDSSGVSHTHPDDWHDILQVTTPCELLKKCSHFSKYFPFSKGNKLKKLYEVILTLWTLRSGRGKKCTWGKKITEPKRRWIASVRRKKKDLNNPKEVHTKHKIKRHFWTPRGQERSVGIKKPIKMLVRRRRNQKVEKLTMFSSPLFRWGMFIRNCGGTDTQVWDLLLLKDREGVWDTRSCPLVSGTALVQSSGETLTTR